MAEQPPDESDAVADGVPDSLPSPAVAEGADADLAVSFADLSRLSAARLSLEDLLTRVATFAVHAIPGANGTGLMLIEPGRSDTIVTSAAFVEQVDDIQYSINEGPCILAAETGETVRSGSLGGDPRWPQFGPRVARLGVHSVLSLPLLTPGGVVGAINVYAHAKDAFDDRAQQIGQLFAVPAAIAVQNAHILAQTRRLTMNLQQALVNRAVIDQAVGIIISRTGGTPDEAFDRLRTISMKEHIKVSTVASGVLKAAAQRARTRTRADGGGGG